MTPSPSRYRALLCLLLVVACTLAAWPFAETGLDDDFSYIFSARALAQTGHVHYAGWASAMVGWQLLLGAAFIRIFGFSFSVARLPLLLIAAVTAFVLHRLLVRSGLSANNAVLATLTVMLSPMALPLAFSFMTDMSGLFCTVLCAYCCVRALQAERSGPLLTWLIVAMIGTAVGGTARQTVWLCLLAMVPSTAWLLRGRRLPLVWLAPVWVGSGGFAFASMQWFYRQNYSVRELPIAAYIDRDLVVQVVSNLARAGLQCCLLLLPVLVAFVAVFPVRSRVAWRWAAGVGVLMAALFGFAVHRGQVALWLLPFHEAGNFFSSVGVVDLREIGIRPPGLPVWCQLLLTLVTVTAVVATVAFALGNSRGIGRTAKLQAAVVSVQRGDADEGSDGEGNRPLTWRELLRLSVPFCIAYLGLVMHRAIFAFAYDRYFLPVLPFAVLLLVRAYQQRVAAELPRICYAALAMFAMLAVATLHDTYADRRAQLAAAQRLLNAGVPRTAFYGGFEYDGWTQIEQMGWMNVIAMRWPDGVHMDRPIPRSMSVKPCGQMFAHLVPAIKPRYGISFDDKACDGPSTFSPEVYNTWLPPFTRQLWIRSVTTPAF